MKPDLAYLHVYTGKPVDDPSHMPDYLLSVFAYRPSLAEAVHKQKTECQEWAERRR